jgi:putative ATP-dependent endonuclease of OLD family
MKIESIYIKNFRAFKEVEVSLDAYTCIVGANGCGKSTILQALNVFFREADNASTDLINLSAEDFHQADPSKPPNTSEPIEIRLTFTNLSKEAQEDFKDYFRQGKLIVATIAHYNSGEEKAETKQCGYRLGLADFIPFFEAYSDGAQVKDLQKIYASLKEKHPDLANEKVKESMVQALRTYEAENSKKCVLIASTDQFYGVSKGKDRLEKYIQWVYVPAVKDALQEETENKNSALGKLLSRTVRAKVNFGEAIDKLTAETRKQYQKILDDNQAALKSVGKRLNDKIVQWAHPEASLDLSWKKDPSRSITINEPIANIIAGERGFKGNLARLGHGFQRSYLLVLLQELVLDEEDKTTPTLILGCEEPELYQHPPQSRHLSGLLQELSKTNAQIVVTTHNPIFVSGRDFESIRMVRYSAPKKNTFVESVDAEAIIKDHAAVLGEKPVILSAGLAKIHQALQPALNEMFFTNRLVLTEGLEDISYINSWLILNDLMEKFRASGCHIVPTNKKSEMIRPAIIAKHLGIPSLLIFDADGDKINSDSKKAYHTKDNVALLRIVGGDIKVPFPTTAIFNDKYVVWPHDLATSVAEEIKSSLGDKKLEEIKNKAHANLGQAPDMAKTDLFIGEFLFLAKEAGAKIPSLDKLCALLIKFGN